MYEETLPPSKKSRLNAGGDRHLQLEPRTTNKHSDATPISMLSDDILFFIFSINSRIEMMPVDKEYGITNDTLYYDEDPLTTNRYSSQVCQRWRNIILSSPTIWANALNIDELNQHGDEWRHEVFDRTGNAPLSLVGRLVYESYDQGIHAVPFVVDILSWEWHRIKYLSICSNNREIRAQLLFSLREPAPTMEYFLYWTAKLDGQEPDSLPEGEMLFSNMSPRLSFICCKGFTFKFAPGAMSNVRQLWLWGHRAFFTIPELYHGLRQLPLLEELLIDHQELLESAELGDHTLSISLPRLTSIVIHNPGTKLITDLVRHLEPAQGCQLIVPALSYDSVDLYSVGQFYATFIENIAQFQFIPSIRFHFRQKGGFWLRASDIPRRRRFLSPILSRAYISIGFTVFSPTNTTEISILNEFSIPIMKAFASRRDLGHVTRLHLGLDENAIVHCKAEVLMILRELDSVVELDTDLCTLQVLVTLHTNPGGNVLILPSMTTVILEGKVSPKYPLDAFLEGRLDSGVPVKVLKLRKDNYSDDGRWSFLKQIDGLSVLWMPYKYACYGSDVIDTEEELDLGP